MHSIKNSIKELISSSLVIFNLFIFTSSRKKLTGGKFSSDIVETLETSSSFLQLTHL